MIKNVLWKETLRSEKILSISRICFCQLEKRTAPLHWAVERACSGPLRLGSRSAQQVSALVLLPGHLPTRTPPPDVG